MRSSARSGLLASEGMRCEAIPTTGPGTAAELRARRHGSRRGPDLRGRRRRHHQRSGQRHGRLRRFRSEFCQREPPTCWPTNWGSANAWSAPRIAACRMRAGARSPWVCSTGHCDERSALLSVDGGRGSGCRHRVSPGAGLEGRPWKGRVLDRWFCESWAADCPSSPWKRRGGHFGPVLRWRAAFAITAATWKSRVAFRCSTTSSKWCCSRARILSRI